MNGYDQYIEIMPFLKNGWSTTPIFYQDEEITNLTDFIQLRGATSFAQQRKCPTVVHDIHNTYQALCYSKYRGLSFNYANQVVETFTNRKVGDLLIIWDDTNLITTMLEKDLFETIVTFRVTSEHTINN